MFRLLIQTHCLKAKPARGHDSHPFQTNDTNMHRHTHGYVALPQSYGGRRGYS